MWNKYLIIIFTIASWAYLQQTHKSFLLQISLSRCFDMKDLARRGVVILNIKPLWDDNGGIILLPSHYMEKVLSNFGYDVWRFSPTPYDHSVVLRKNRKIANVQLRYYHIISSLMYLFNSTKPDISFAMRKLCRFI